jgi:hypothetical protein
VPFCLRYFRPGRGEDSGMLIVSQASLVEDYAKRLAGQGYIVEPAELPAAFAASSEGAPAAKERLP